MVLTIYDFRGIQDYIFRTNKMKEIIGASTNVENKLITIFQQSCEKELCTCREGEYYKKKNASGEWDGLRIPNDHLDAEIVYYGGGNLLVVYKDQDTSDRVTRQMRMSLTIETYSLQLAVASVEMSDRYVTDYANLMTQLHEQKEKMPQILPLQGLPFTSNDPVTGFPFSTMYDEKRGDKKVSKKVTLETSSKLQSVGHRKVPDFEGRVAIIHIDGNGLGAYIANLLSGLEKATYDEAIKTLRQMSVSIQNIFVNTALGKVRNYVLNNTLSNGKSIQYREIIKAGDDITFIVNAEVALKCVEVFFDHLDSSFTAAAGIYICHAHFPFRRAYDLAEELCSKAKEKSERKCNAFDFHVNYGGVLHDIDTIRSNEYVSALGNPLYERPYIYKEEDYSNFIAILSWIGCSEKSKLKISRNKAKQLREDYVLGNAYVIEGAEKIYSRQPRDKRKVIQNLFSQKEYRILFDAIDVMDLNWGECDEKTTD